MCPMQAAGTHELLYCIKNINLYIQHFFLNTYVLYSFSMIFYFHVLNVPYSNCILIRCLTQEKKKITSKGHLKFDMKMKSSFKG